MKWKDLSSEDREIVITDLNLQVAELNRHENNSLSLATHNDKHHDYYMDNANWCSRKSEIIRAAIEKLQTLDLLVVQTELEHNEVLELNLDDDF